MRRNFSCIDNTLASHSYAMFKGVELLFWGLKWLGFSLKPLTYL
jgi:hypothetical protein